MFEINRSSCSLGAGNIYKAGNFKSKSQYTYQSSTSVGSYINARKNLLISNPNGLVELRGSTFKAGKTFTIEAKKLLLSAGINREYENLAGTSL